MSGLLFSAVHAETNDFSETGSLNIDPLNQAQAHFLKLLNDGLYDEAVVAARQTLEISRWTYGNNSLEAALAQINLATSQSYTHDYKTAIDNYQSSIAIIEAIEGIISPRLINPLMGLAAAYNASGLHNLALLAYERSLRVNHVELGLQNEQQMPIRDGLTESYIALGNQRKAGRQQEVQLTIIKNEYGENSERLLPAIYKLAKWYQRTNQPEQEAYQYRSALRLIQNNTNKQSPEQVDVLRNLAALYQRNNMPAETLRLLKRSYRINAEADGPDPLLAADIQVQIGDAYNFFGERRNSQRYYVDAWNTLEQLGDQEALLEEYFAVPVHLGNAQLAEIYPSNLKTMTHYQENPDKFENGYITARFDIDTNGQVKNIRIIESYPSGLLEKHLRMKLSRQKFRPQIMDGIPVETKDEQLQHQFKYEPQSEDTHNDGKSDRIERPQKTG
ncbi:MAG: tetratricopeptide repeat protein [Gammaproteobacteria bacterium]|nr:tetratricopeptide repeat protein [Gammaproteobacteria bacterium]MCP4089038.1 tetratricopeptide repeat protein [Gammaproteobacteria bacterium]MCP4278062.1 tetratricopeptide repeat protein [Gammaproteobacteria bacterium]MCP4833038.1 tetratricopeptide repeat protein [Gammaproteobacteria bacterium]